MKVVCISDTHSKHQRVKVPNGDLLIHAGDVSRRGTPEEIRQFNEWIGTLPHPHKVIIAGNHDFLFENEPEFAESLITNATYLNDSGVTIEGIRIWGSPISPEFHDWAFNRKRGEEIRKYWEMIPSNTDILITHGPPKGILDRTVLGSRVGCVDLAEIVAQIRPKYHIFGHIHEAQGVKEIDGTTYINASMLNLLYMASHKAVVFDIPTTK